MKKKNLKGFTLIELLVVIVIVGLLAAVSWISIYNAQLRSKDARVQTALFEVRNVAETSYSAVGNYDAVCADDNTLSDSGDFNLIEQEVMKFNGNQVVLCYEGIDKQTYAVSSPLRSRAGKHWCVSSVGIAKEIDAPITNSSCP